MLGLPSSFSLGFSVLLKQLRSPHPLHLFPHPAPFFLHVNVTIIAYFCNDSLYLQAMSPDGESIVTGAGDETLRFWHVFSKVGQQKVVRSKLNLLSSIR